MGGGALSKRATLLSVGSFGRDEDRVPPLPHAVGMEPSLVQG